jgi:hypothetical protein
MNMMWFLLYGFGLDSAHAWTMSLLACCMMPGSLDACALDARRNLNVASATDLTAVLPVGWVLRVVDNGMPCLCCDMINSFIKVQTKTAPKWVLRDTVL